MTLREAKGLSQTDLAKKVGVAQSYIAMLESGDKKNPSLAILKRLARALDVDAGRLLGTRPPKIDTTTASPTPPTHADRRRGKGMTRDRERLKDEYFFAASEYYAAGRFAFWTKSPSICGNLLHHAIELFLKGHLLLTMTPKELMDLSHSLPRIWRRFKKDTITDSRLAAFDRTIDNVHAFEALRYPDSVIEKGAIFHFEVTRADLDRSRAADHMPGQPPRYLLALEEVDRLVLLLFHVCSRNPAVFLRGKIANPGRLKYLTESNPVWPHGTEE